MKRLLIYILISYSFTTYAQNGVITGRVYNELTNEPVAFAYVEITGQPLIGALTDLDGKFIITGLPAGIVTVTASFIGFKTVISRDIQVTNAKQAYVEIAMQKDVQMLEGVVVKASPFIKPEESPLSLQRIGLQEIDANPGSNRDISKVIQSFPGVGSTVSFRNDIIIRGGGPNESRFYLDGIEIPNLNHFSTQGSSGGPVGIINADFIGGVDFYSGAFPAMYGNALSGVFDFSQISGNKEKTKFRGSVGASELSATLDGPSGDNSTYIASVRRSYLQFLFDAIGLPFLPTFTDYQIKHKTLFPDRSELTIVSIGALDDFSLNLGLENPDESQEYILAYLPVTKQWSYAIGANYKKFTDAGYHRYVVSRNMLNNISYKYPENNENLPRILDYSSQEMENKVRYEYVTRKNGYKITYGLSSEFAKYTNDTYQKRTVQDQVFEINYNANIDLFKYGAFTQISKKVFEERLVVSGGLRVDGNSYSPSMANPLTQISPRLSLSYGLNEKINLNFNTGRYYQLPPYTSLGFKNNAGEYVNKKNEITYISVNHIISGIQYQLNKQVVFTVEGFFKQYDKYPFSVKDSISLASKGGDFGVLGDEEIISIGKGRAYGMEFMNRMRLTNGFTSTVSYTLVRSESQDYYGMYVPTSWDSKHLVSATLSKNFSNKWIVGAKWRYVGGLPYTPYDMEESAIKAVWDTRGGPVLDYSRYNKERFKAFHQLDVRVDRRWFFQTWSFMVYVDVQNAYNYKAQQQDIILREKDSDGNFILENGDTTYKLRRISNTSGTVLPTLGIMIEF
ncbi:MAG TPA: TonB-dependent receptor [Bacteroidales bacterium]|nr:TonB-dependent receptor [Bacteroidales bacterium]